ncbi:tetratricopeptide repeat protein [Thalassotalea sp. PS06]|uniref:tetratricopeptide repeat protein n=1 Tax=Thalassotalea sp. PS06 TaxID=2594005 RepID=UPI001163BB22|nr:tetratricopeptide repeat protein [Thalassotalea sp. PS06]QDP01931.1 tetratricopeptide repeat protein [Thalassotalea sp. PS06]
MRNQQYSKSRADTPRKIKQFLTQGCLHSRKDNLLSNGDSFSLSKCARQVGFVLLSAISASTMSFQVAADQEGTTVAEQLQEHKVRTNQLDLSTSLAAYEYYQGNYFDALTELSLGKKELGEAVTANGELFAAGLNLHFDINSDAARKFEESLNAIEDPQYRDSAWFLLAKSFASKQNVNGATQALSKVGDNLPDYMLDDYYYLLAQMHIANGKMDQVGQARLNIPAESVYHCYITFNEAVKWVELGDLDQAIKHFKQTVALAKQLPVSDESEALSDRANVAMGYLYIQQGMNDQAVASFKEVTQNNLDTHSAMLGYGWAMANKNEYYAAIAIWQQLTGQTLQSPFVREAFIAVAYGYEQLDDLQSAHTAFNNALQHFNQQQAITIGALNMVKSEAFFDSVVQHSIDVAEANKRRGLKGADVSLTLPPQLHSAQLAASKSFQNKLKDLQDVNAIITQLLEWQSRADALAEGYYGTLTEDLDMSFEAEQQVNQQRIQTFMTSLVQHSDSLNSQWQTHQGRIYQDSKVEAKQTKLLEDLARYRQLTESFENQVGVDKESEEYKQDLQRLNRIGGVLLWQLGDYFLDNQGASDKFDTVIAAGRYQEASATELTPINNLRAKLQGKLNDALLVRSEITRDMQTQLQTSLTTQLQDIDHYVQQAQLAIVRLQNAGFQQDNEFNDTNSGGGQE